MKALRYEQSRLTLADVAPPSAGGEALIRVLLSGICNTDLEIARGYAGFTGTLGHEFVGVVEDAPNRELVGKRVVGEINAGCGRCELCRAGDARHCLQRTVLGIVNRDGAHAEFVQLPIENLLIVPDEVSDRAAVFTEPLAAAVGIMERVDVTSETRIAIVGDGKLGLLCAQALRQRSSYVTLVGKHAEKMRIAARRDIETIFAAEAEGRARGFDVVVEASGAASGLETAGKLVRPRGVIVLKSTFAGKTTLDLAPVVVDEISIVGSRCGRFAPALRMLAGGAVDVESMISEEMPLGQGIEAMRRAGERGVLKVLLRPYRAGSLSEVIFGCIVTVEL